MLEQTLAESKPEEKNDGKCNYELLDIRRVKKGTGKSKHPCSELQKLYTVLQ